MSYFINNEIPSCSSCDYATEYIPLFTFRYSDPYCHKGHGKCKVDKICSDYKPMSVCGRCVFMKTGRNDFVCTLHDKKVSWNSKCCADFKEA